MYNISNMKDLVSPHFQTPRTELKSATLRGVFLTKLEMFGNEVKQCRYYLFINLPITMADENN